MVWLCPQETSTTILTSIISPIQRGQVSSSQPLIIMMSFHCRRDVSKWVRNLQLNLCQGYLRKEKSRQYLSQDDTGGNKHSTDSREKAIIVTSSFIAICGKTVHLCMKSLSMTDKLECLWWRIRSSVLMGKELVWSAKI